MDKTFEFLTFLIRAAICREKVDFSKYAPDSFDSAFRLALKHDIAQIVSAAIINGSYVNNDKTVKTAQKFIFKAAYRDTKNTYTYNFASDILNTNKIPFVPLKGMIIRELYPESFMRTNCDIDILVKESDFQKAAKVLTESGFKRSGDLRFHDISLFYDNTNLELHFRILEGINGIDKVLSRVWQNAVLDEGYKYLQTNEFFVFHHIAHMAYHFLSGGCGIRPFIDLWILSRNDYYDDYKVYGLCKEAEIGEFYKAVMQTVNCWFEGGACTDITERITAYVLNGGVYGNYQNKAAIRTVRKGGKLRNLISSAFPKYERMKTPYPILHKYPFLLPFCYVSRLFSNTLGKKSDKGIKKYKTIKNQDESVIKGVASLLNDLKLN